MQFKSPTDKPIYVSILSGHTAIIGSEYRDLPLILHRKALEEGCITDTMDQATIDAKFEASKPAPENKQILVDIIKEMMANPKDGDFTGADLPNRKTLSALAGWSVSKEEMMQAVHAISVEDSEPA